MSLIMLSLIVLLSGVAEKCFAESEVKTTFFSPKANSKKDDEARAALRKIIGEKKAELNGTSWDVTIESRAGKGSFLGKDTLIFQNERFRSLTAEKNDFSATNYTLTVQEQGPTVWETMQTGKNGEVAFWRGEWKEGVMTGVISRQLEKGAEEYSFSSSAKKEISKTSSEDEKEINPKGELKPELESQPEMKPAVLGGAAVTLPKDAPNKTQKKSSWLF